MKNFIVFGIVSFLIVSVLFSAYGQQEVRCLCEKPKIEPLIRGALWWLTSAYDGWTEDDWEKAIQAQCDVGFDVLWIFNTPALLKQAEQEGQNNRQDTRFDVLDTVYRIAAEKKMRIIADLPKGGWYQKNSQEEILAINTEYIRKYHARYGHYRSFWGWYLNYEINPIAPDDKEESLFWRKLWRDISDECHRVAPGSVVTISPFFLLDKDRVRGFIYLEPEQYASWWGETLAASKIDILMLQDSGEHLSFFTLEQRKPFFEAVRNACHKAGAQFWVNVETGEAHVDDWDDYLKRTKEKNVPWRFTPIEWLEKKLHLAACYGDGIINWGYFPFMDPLPAKPGEADFNERAQNAYQAYKAYYERIKK